MSIWALLPFKGSKSAKRRLRPALNEAEREELVMAMLGDVLDTLTHSPGVAGVLLVSRDAMATEQAKKFAVDVFAESATDLSGAVRQASGHVARRHAASGTLFVPGDVPLVTPADIAAVLDGHERVTLVPDMNDIGTNAAASSPPNAFEYLFDGKSFKPHIAAARRAGITARIVRRADFGIDVDTVSELAAVAERADGTRTATFLAHSGIARRILCDYCPP